MKQLNSVNIVLSMSKQEKILFAILFLLGITLRFFQFTRIPFTNDELSALNRLNYPDFQSMLNNAVWTDGHPAGVQTFLWFYKKLFGMSQAAIKFPFIFMASASLLFNFFAAKKLTNTQTALFTLAFLATLQYPILYSQTIRPYSSGQFLSSICLYLWACLIYEKPSNRTYQILLGVAIFLSLSNHYFNILFVALLFPTGFLIKKQTSLFNYVLPFIIGFILYIPQLPIFLHQFSVGSPGWLSTPTIHTLLKHFEYCFQFSGVYLVLFAVLLVIKIIKYPQDSIPKTKSWIWLILYITPILLSFVYSIYRAPIFQDSIFIFSFIFLFLFLGDSLLSAHYNFKTTTIILAIIVFINFELLAFKRKHFYEYYHQGYSQLVSDTYKFQNKTCSVPTLVFGFESFFFNYYETQFQHPKIKQIQFMRDDFFAKTAKNPNDFFRILRRWNYSQIIVSNAIEIPQWAIDVLENEYPYSIKSLHFGSEVYVFSKDNSIQSSYYIKNPNSVYKRLLLTTENGIHEFSLFSMYKKETVTFNTEKWHCTTKFNLDSVMNNRRFFGHKDYKHAIIKITASIEINSKSRNIDSVLNGLHLVLSVADRKKQNVHFMHESFDRWKDTATKQYNCILTANCNHFEVDPKGMISTFIENNSNTPIKVAQFKVTISQGNNSIYSLVNDF